MTALLTPYDKGTAKPAGRNLFRKQLLPIARIDYKGRIIDFTKEYLSGLVKAFNNRAYDQVPFQLAPHGNSTQTTRSAGAVRSPRWNSPMTAWT